MQDKELEKIFKAFANKRRIAIIKYLKHSNQSSVGDIANEIKLSLKATSKHLLILSMVDIVEKEQIGLTMLYQLSKNQSQVSSMLIRQL